VRPSDSFIFCTYLIALLSLLNKLVHDLRTTLAPSYVDLLEVLLRLLPRLISAPSLTALLALSGILRYLLVPSIKLDLLDQTWSSFRAVLPTCSPEVQRAAAEVWGSVLRRLKSIARQTAVVFSGTELGECRRARGWWCLHAKYVCCAPQVVHFNKPAVCFPNPAYKCRIIDCLPHRLSPNE
jgi:U3 small nucleolar RNA-associated protein 20